MMKIAHFCEGADVHENLMFNHHMPQARSSESFDQAGWYTIAHEPKIIKALSSHEPSHVVLYKP